MPLKGATYSYCVWAVLLLLASCASSPITQRSLPVRGQVTIGYDSIRSFPNGSEYAQFIIYNETDSTFWFSAEGKYLHDGHLTTHPLYSMKVEYDDRWKDDSPFWCLTGVERYAVEPGEHLYFTTSMPTKKSRAFKAGIYFSLTKDPRGQTREIWSSEVRLR